MRQKEKSCAHCGETFTPERRNGMYCSNTCRQYSYLSRKNGETNVLPKKRVPVEFDNDVPALVIEEDEEFESLPVNSPSIPNQYPSVNYQFKEKNKTSNSINTVKSIDWNYSGSSNNSINNQPNKITEQMRPDHLNNQSSENKLPIPVVELKNDQFYFIDDVNKETNNGFEIENEMQNTSYAALLEQERKRANISLKVIWDMCKTDKTIKSIIDKFGQRIKPYFISLAAMDGRAIETKVLVTLQKDMERLANIYLPISNCPTSYPPINFYERAIEDNLKKLIAELEVKNCQVVFIKFSDWAKARHEINMKLIAFISPNTPESVLLP